MEKEQTQTRKYWHGIDYLRVLFILFVVADNTHLFRIFSHHISEENPQITPYHLLVGNVLFLAVPGFMLISMFLFFSRNNGGTNNRKRIKHLLYLYIFWIALWVLDFQTFPEPSLKEIFLYLVQGAYSPFYFLFSLLLLTIIASFSRSLNKNKTILLTIASMLLVFSFPIINIIDPQYGDLLKHWNPLQFIPCVFIGKLIADRQKSVEKKDGFPAQTVIALIVLYIMFAVGEWQFLYYGDHALPGYLIMPMYGRLSLMFGAAGLVILGTQIKRPAPKVVKFLSDSSLGIYATHIFILEHIKSNLPENVILSFFLTLFISIALTQIIRTLMKRINLTLPRIM